MLHNLNFSTEFHLPNGSKSRGFVWHDRMLVPDFKNLVWKAFVRANGSRFWEQSPVAIFTENDCRNDMLASWMAENSFPDFDALFWYSKDMWEKVPA